MTSQVPSFDEEAGTVLEQDPAPDQSSDDDILRLTVAREPTPVAVVRDQGLRSRGRQRGESRPAAQPHRRQETTRWTTELYRSAAFGEHRQDGVGLEFTLEGDATIMEIISTVEGWKGELLQKVSSGPAARLATLDGNTTQIITLREPLDRRPHLVHRADRVRRRPLGRGYLGDPLLPLAAAGGANSGATDATEHALPRCRVPVLGDDGEPGHPGPPQSHDHGRRDHDHGGQEEPVGRPHHHALPVAAVGEGPEGPGVHGHGDPPRPAHGPGQQREGVATQSRPRVQPRRSLTPRTR